MSTDDINTMLWRIMLENPEYEELDCIFALNGILADHHFDKLTPEERDKLLGRLAIGIQIYNLHLNEDMKQLTDWKALPKIKISGGPNE